MSSALSTFWLHKRCVSLISHSKQVEVKGYTHRHTDRHRIKQNTHTTKRCGCLESVDLVHKFSADFVFNFNEMAEKLPQRRLLKGDITIKKP